MQTEIDISLILQGLKAGKVQRTQESLDKLIKLVEPEISDA